MLVWAKAHTDKGEILKCESHRPSSNRSSLGAARSLMLEQRPMRGPVKGHGQDPKGWGGVIDALSDLQHPLVMVVKVLQAGGYPNGMAPFAIGPCGGGP